MIRLSARVLMLYKCQQHSAVQGAGSLIEHRVSFLLECAEHLLDDIAMLCGHRLYASCIN